MKIQLHKWLATEYNKEAKEINEKEKQLKKEIATHKKEIEDILNVSQSLTEQCIKNDILWSEIANVGINKEEVDMQMKKIEDEEKVSFVKEIRESRILFQENVAKIEKEKAYKSEIIAYPELNFSKSSFQSNISNSNEPEKTQIKSTYK